MTKVKILNGTSDDDSSLKGYPIWKAFWEAKIWREFDSCSCKGFEESAAVGVH